MADQVSPGAASDEIVPDDEFDSLEPDVEKAVAAAPKTLRRDLIDALLQLRKLGTKEAMQRVASVLGSIMDAPSLGVAGATRANALQLPQGFSTLTEDERGKILESFLNPEVDDALADAKDMQSLLKATGDILGPLIDVYTVDKQTSGDVAEERIKGLSALRELQMGLVTGKNDPRGAEGEGGTRRAPEAAAAVINTVPELGSNPGNIRTLATDLTKALQGHSGDGATEATLMELTKELSALGATTIDGRKITSIEDTLEYLANGESVDDPGDPINTLRRQYQKDQTRTPGISYIDPAKMAETVEAAKREVEKYGAGSPIAKRLYETLDLYTEAVNAALGKINVDIDDLRSKAEKQRMAAVTEFTGMDPAKAQALIDSRAGVREYQKILREDFNDPMTYEKLRKLLSNSDVAKAVGETIGVDTTNLEVAIPTMIQYAAKVNEAEKRMGRIQARSYDKSEPQKERRKERIERIREKNDPYFKAFTQDENLELGFDPSAKYVPAGSRDVSTARSTTVSGQQTSTPAEGEKPSTEGAVSKTQETEAQRRMKAFAKGFTEARDKMPEVPEKLALNHYDIAVPGSAAWEEEDYADDEAAKEFRRRLLGVKELQTPTAVT
jgi:hypothetical protein